MSTKTPAPDAENVQASQRAAVEGHGNSPAAWTMVLVGLLGVLIGCIGFVMASMPVFIVGVVVLVIGFILGIVLRAAGFGAGGARLKNKGH